MPGQVLGAEPVGGETYIRGSEVTCLDFMGCSRARQWHVNSAGLGPKF